MWDFWISVNNAAIVVRLVYIAAIAAIVLTQRNEEAGSRGTLARWRDAMWQPVAAPSPDGHAVPFTLSALGLGPRTGSLATPARTAEGE
jgi:hypothetical protein